MNKKLLSLLLALCLVFSMIPMNGFAHVAKDTPNIKTVRGADNLDEETGEEVFEEEEEEEGEEEEEPEYELHTLTVEHNLEDLDFLKKEDGDYRIYVDSTNSELAGLPKGTTKMECDGIPDGLWNISIDGLNRIKGKELKKIVLTSSKEGSEPHEVIIGGRPLKAPQFTPDPNMGGRRTDYYLSPALCETMGFGAVSFVYENFPDKNGIDNGTLLIESIGDYSEDIKVEFIWGEPTVYDEYENAYSADEKLGTVETEHDKDDNGMPCWKLITKPRRHYMLDYWEVSCDGGKTYPEKDRIINDDNNNFHTIEIQENDDRFYRAVFKPAHIIISDGLTLQEYSWGPGGEEWKLGSAIWYSKFSSGRPIDYDNIGSTIVPKRTIVREGSDALIGFIITVPCKFEHDEYNGIIEIYKDDEKKPIQTVKIGKDNVGIDHRLQNLDDEIFMLLDDVPYMESVTLKITVSFLDTGFTTYSEKRYELNDGNGVEKDEVKKERLETFAKLSKHYEETYYEKISEKENMESMHKETEPIPDDDGSYAGYDSFSPVRILLRYAYEDAFRRIRWDAKTEQDLEDEYNGAVKRLKEYAQLNEKIKSGDSEAYRNVEGVIKVLFYHNIEDRNVPCFAYVPEGSVVKDALQAAMESFNPRRWSIYGKSFITAMDGHEGNGKIEKGGYSSQIVYSRNHGWANGVGIQSLTDRDVITFGKTIVSNVFPRMEELPDKQELIWACGVLCEKYELRELKTNPVFAKAHDMIHDWGLTSEGDKGIPMFPNNLEAAQGHVDKAVENLVKAYPEVNFTRYFIPESVKNVITLIKKIGTVNTESGEKIAAARKAYDALDALTYMDKDYTKEEVQSMVINYDVLVLAEGALIALKEADKNKDYDEALGGVIKYIQESTKPEINSTGGEWAVIGLARAYAEDMDSQWTKGYLDKLDEALAAGNIKGVTEYERITLALTALDLDATDYKGNDMTASFASYDESLPINAKIFALIALNSRPYESEATASYLKDILGSALDDGGWNLAGSEADIDVTAMAIQALAPYYSENEDVKEAVDKALLVLREKQDKNNGGFNNFYGELSTCSTAQVVTALSSLGIDAASDDWKVMGGKTAITGLLTFYNKEKGYFGETNTAENNMATEQAAYALVAYDRMVSKQNALYDMRDASASSDNRVESVYVDKVKARLIGDGIFEANLPKGTHIGGFMHSLTEVTLKNPKAKQSNITSEENGHILHFTVTAANGSEKEYTVYVKADAVPKIEQAEELVKTEIWTIAMNEANSEETVKQWIQNKIDSMDLGGITYELVMGDVTPAIGGTNENKAGTDGSFNFTVKLTSEDGGNQSNKDVEITGKIKADKYKEIPIVETDINVSFRLIGAKLSRGDIDLADGDYKGGDYVTWIKTKNYALPAQSTVYALFNRALGEAGLNSQGADQNYVKTIYAPSVCGGYELSHFTNGPKSGWMYTVNGKHPNLGLKEYKLNNGDNVVFHYVNDYRYEVDDWKGSGEHPSLGDGKLHNKWLEAEDKDPTKVNAEESITTYTSEAGNITTVKADVKISKETVGEKTINKAIITIKDENIPEILKQAKKNESEAIILDANVKEANADKVMVEISKKTAEDILKETKADLVIALPETELKLSRDALKEIASQAKGDKLTMEIEKVKTPTDEQKKLAGESAEIFVLNVKGGDTVIHDFGKGMVTVRKLIPDRLKEKKVAAVYLTEKGQLEVLKGKKIVIDKQNFFEFTTNHFSYFALVDADEAGIEVEEMMSADEVKNLVKTLKLKVKTKALKRSVRVIVKADKTSLNNLRDNGYTVKYKFYRATHKKGKFKLVSTKDVNKYTNVKITKGKTYYYKAKIFVYDSLGNLVTKTSFKQSDTAKAKVKAFKKAA